jgi:hypothetical protein
MSNYSFSTSLPAYKDNADIKQRQQDEVYQLILKGADNLLKISQQIQLEQGRISARLSDLIKEKKVRYDGFVYYAGADGKLRKRKKIVIIKPEYIQTELNLIK